MVSDEVKLFVYSDIQIKSDKEINKKIGRDFKCGDVSIGSKRHKYSKIIKKSELQSMCAQYPDTKIVTEGKLSSMNYTPITNNFIKG